MKSLVGTEWRFFCAIRPEKEINERKRRKMKWRRRKKRRRRRKGWSTMWLFPEKDKCHKVTKERKK